jgi:hypothetical protein
VKTFFTVIKGARSAPDRAGRHTGMAPRDAPLTEWRRSTRPQLAGRRGNPYRAGRRLPSFGPSGHVGAGAHSPPRSTAQATRRNFSGGARGHGARPSLRRPHCEALQDHGQGRTSPLRCGRSTLTVSLGRDSIGAYRRDGPDRALFGSSPVTMLNPMLRYASFMVAREAPDNESLRLELQEAIGTFRHWNTQLTQVGGFVATGDVVLLSYGFSQRLAAILLFASGFPMVILLLYLYIGSINIPLVSLILRIERKLLIQDDSLGATYLRAQLPSLTPIPGTIEELTDEEVHRLNLSLSMSHWLWTPVPIVLYTSTIVQVGLFVLSLTVFHYRFM